MTNHAVRVQALRNEMNIFNVDGFIIPRADEHQGEYVAPCSERLNWICGFTGSAGMAIVLNEKACVFVDGRYTIQVEQQVDHDLFERRHVSDQPADVWLEAHLKKGQKLAYDPWLHTGPSLHRLEQACKRIGAELVPAPHNFIDAVWQDRPAAPMDPVLVHDLSYSGQNHQEKIGDIAQQLQDAGQDAMVLSLPDSIAWLFNIRGSDIPCTPVALGFAILYSNAQAILFFAQQKCASSVRTHLGDNVTIRDPDELGEVLDSLGAEGKTVRLDGASIPKWIHTRLKAKGANVQLGDDLCILPKACKNTVEAAGMVNAHKRDGVHMVRFLYWLSEQPYGPDINEHSVAEYLDNQRARDDLFVDFSFQTISGAAGNGAIVHYRHEEERALALPENGLYLVDSGGQYHDGTTDITRTIVRGTPSAEMKDRFTRVLKGHIALSTARFPKGTSGSQLDVLARSALWQGGYDYDHGTGHGVGSFLSVHEGPQRISKLPSRQALMPGMVISNEPGYYKTDAYGIRLENLVIVREESGFERDMLCFEALTLCPFDLNGIDLDLLNSEEINWLNSYHQTVFDELSPSLNDKQVAWLREATRPV